MAEIDYQLALLLQHKFEQEARKPKEHKSDVELAKILQEQFEKETEISAPKNGLVYKNTKNDPNSTKCLVDPSWEVIDPTPDIHVLFMSFNDRFFWGALMAVCVSWSKRMTTCAGICAYQGRSGLCSITLSEPLLKLRPRKDLVETLLHEMIHAYLFVTNNNRDRDGHGPEFHNHMFRINKEAGTNITVYHDFHDEVRLYKQHWWRCNGPCQKLKPYFGMVRRAMNRAPGPNDRWWAEHSRNCGGSFIKVREPEKPVKKAPTKGKPKPKEDIRKYISPIKKPTISTPTNRDNVHTITNDVDKNKKISAVIPKENIFGFTNLNGSQGGFKGKGGGTAVKNNSNTIVINKKPTATSSSTAAQPSVSSSSVTTSPGHILKTLSGSQKPSFSSSSTIAQPSPSSSSTTTSPGPVINGSSVKSDNADYAAVRNHWLNKFSNGSSNGVKRTASSTTPVASEKIPRLQESNVVDPDLEIVESTAECPICFESVNLSSFNEHLDQCLEKPKTKECIICGKDITVAEYEIHVTKCSEENFDKPDGDPELKKCGICEKMLTVSEFGEHVEKCLHKLYDDMEMEYSKDEHVNCLTCNKDILRSELNTHLDNCLGLSRVFEDDSLSKDVEEEDFCDSDKQNKYNCPFCMVLLPEEEMSAHIDLCLSTPSDSAETDLNKRILVESLMDDEF